MEDEGFSKTYYNPLPNDKIIKEEEKKEVRAWKEEANQRLDESDYPYKVYNSRWHNFLVSVFIIFVIIAISALIFLIWSGKFQTIIDIKQPITNFYNHTIAPVIDNQVANTYNNQFSNNPNITIVINKLEVNTNAS